VAAEQILEAGMTFYPLNPKALKPTGNAKHPVGFPRRLLEAWKFADRYGDGQD